MASIDELKKLVASWQKVEENGGSPTSAVKLAAAKKALKEAEEAAKPAKKARKAKKAEPVEEIIEEEPTIYTESELLSMTNSDLRDIAYGLDPEAAVSNKSKKKLVALIEELQNESSST